MWWLAHPPPLPSLLALLSLLKSSWRQEQKKTKQNEPEKCSEKVKERDKDKGENLKSPDVR